MAGSKGRLVGHLQLDWPAHEGNTPRHTAAAPLGRSGPSSVEESVHVRTEPTAVRGQAVGPVGLRRPLVTPTEVPPRTRLREPDSRQREGGHRGWLGCAMLDKTEG